MPWFLRRGGEVFGPHPEAEIRRMLEAGEITEATLVAPNRKDFQRVAKWRPLASQGTLDPREFAAPERAALAASPRGTQILGVAHYDEDERAQKGATNRGATKVAGTRNEEPFVAEASPPREGRGTQVIGSAEDATSDAPDSQNSPQGWPGRAQTDPDDTPQSEQPNDRWFTAPAGVSDPSLEEDPLRPLELSENPPPPDPVTDPPLSPLALSARPAPETPAPLREPPRGADALPPIGGPSPRARPQRGALPVERAFAPKLPPVKKSPEWLLFLAVGVGSLLFAFFGALGVDRLLNGATTSDVSAYLPAGGSWYIEVPSVRRLARGFTGLRFVDFGVWKEEERVDAFFQQLGHRKASSDLDKKLLGSVEALAATSVGRALLVAIQYSDAEAMNEYVAQADGKDSTGEFGIRYLREGETTCLWLEDDAVEICGEKGALDQAEQVLRGASPSALEDPNLNAAKKRSLGSYLPFASLPSVHAVATRRMFDESASLENLEGATLALTVDGRGLFEKLDIIRKKPDGPSLLAPGGKLELADRLPLGTLMYATYRPHYPKSTAEFDQLLGSFGPAPPGAPPLRQLVETMKEQLGFHPAELTQGLGEEAAIGVSFPPDAPLSLDPKGRGGAVWFYHTLEDRAQVRKTLGALVERASQEKTSLAWQDEDNLTGTLDDGQRVHVRLSNRYLEVAAGDTAEVKRGMGDGPRLDSDRAHEEAIEEVGEGAVALVWIDWGRLVTADRVRKNLSKKDGANFEKLLGALTTEGQERPTGAVAVRMFDTGAFRIRSRNLPVGLFGLSYSFVTKYVSDRRGEEPPRLPSDQVIERPDPGTVAPEPAESWIGANPDGTFDYPAPE